MISRGWALAAVLAAGAVAGPAAAQGADPSAGWAEMARCGAIANDVARHGCTDGVLRRHGLMAPPEARAAERRRMFGLELPNLPHREAAKADASEGGRQAPPVEAEDTDKITVTLGDVMLRGDGRLVVKTTEGAVWRQVEVEPVRPMPTRGQSMVIERTALGGFKCMPGRWISFRCTREP